MRLFFCATLAILGSHVAAEMPPIPSGTPVELMVLAEVSTRDAQPGTRVRLRLNKPLAIDGVTLLPIGTPAFGVVEAMQDSGIALQRGRLAVRITHLESEGRIIPLSGGAMVRSRGGSGDDAAKIIMVPFYALFAPANSAKLKAGELLTATIAAGGPPADETTQKVLGN